LKTPGKCINSTFNIEKPTTKGMVQHGSEEEGDPTNTQAHHNEEDTSENNDQQSSRGRWAGCE
jgi:hypothetical protein